jgi:hypothetical protein
MKSVDDVKTFFKNATINTNPAGDKAVLADALSAAGLASGQRPVRGGSRIWRATMRNPITKLAIAAAVIAAVAIGFYTIGGSKPAFAEVVRPILTAQTATFTLVLQVPDAPAQTWEGEFMDPGLIRYTITMGDRPEAKVVQVADYVQGKMLTLMPAQKTAMVVTLQNKPEERDPRTMNMFKEWRDRIRQAQEDPGQAVEYLGEARVAGREVIGYRLVENGMRMTIWADAQSLLPVQIESSMIDEPADQASSMMMMDIHFDVPLDPAEFSLAVPPGYSQQTMQMDASPVTEADLITLLRFYAETTGGRFPSELSFAVFKELGAIEKEREKPTIGEEPNLADPAFKELFQDVVQSMMKIGRGVKFVMALPSEADGHYVGQDVAFGDATKPIFWYRPQGSATYRVIYADLSVLDVALENLPK